MCIVCALLSRGSRSSMALLGSCSWRSTICSSAIPVIVFLLAEEGLLHDVSLAIDTTGQDVLLEQKTGLLDLNGLVLRSWILLHKLDEVLARLLAAGLLYLVVIDHSV